MPGEVILEGVIEKKGRKALQGYNKRYFVLESNGRLSYSRDKGEKTRDTVDLRRVTIGRNKRRRALVIDAGNKVPWHCKCLSDRDFEFWTSAFHNFAQVSDDDPSRGRSSAEVKSRQSTSAGAHGSDGANQHLITDKNAGQLIRLVTSMTHTISALEQISEQANGKAPYSDPNASTVGKAFGAVLGTSSSGSAIDTELLSKSVEAIKKQHYNLLTILENTHIASDSASVDSLERAESIASSEYHDAEGGYSYEMDDLDSDALGLSSPSLGSDSSSGFYASDTDRDSSDEADTFDDASSSHSAQTVQAGAGDSKGQGQIHGHDHVKRRKQLPHPVAGEEVSLFGLLKKNMGKDISKISMPVTLNEPINQLQSMAEAIEYTELLDQAAKAKDSMERLLLVTCFAISTYSFAKYRSSRKPFNPLLGETYELVRPDKGLRFIAEKVVHHPNWTACHAEGSGWDYTATASGKQKFWGRSFELIPEGISEVRIKETQEVFSFSRPPSFVRNIMSGEKYLEHIGDMTVKNESTGERAEVQFKEGSSWGGAGSRNKIEGSLYDANGSSKIEISGKWDESISRKTGPKSSDLVWQIRDFPQDAPKYYGFSEWTAQLNEITEDIKGVLPPTDTRLRPDQRAFENGKVDEAEDGKQKLEAKQRDRRQKWEKSSDQEAVPPQFFREDEEGVWHYKGDYWERREKKDWRKDIQIFEV